MFTLYKISLKTTFILFLFITGVSGLLAGNPNKEIVPEIVNYTFQEDTITQKATTEKIESAQENEFNLPSRLTGKAIHFQVNSDISYFRFSHFIKSESKKMFFQAWSKERELARISTQTDSLRKVYVNSKAVLVF